ncbi:glycosyltransferase involved in cell wall biosynthesis [Aneurinibacillus soli]|uniref:2-deoxystreptamine glucosyltransferase n=1 Tax=Aneurinibacillus soli TaxID=1500254 RepID=A0A0U5B827_9BACL|nr:glycosyltransferase [Aneurinibacillus soli]PYE62362.1 glycosyltransferase involved in cell wall biosynthesis [Aneurinibacillus soli]BAU26925.1 2-deoxystreptamine glucosyltransferase [Aneurinibacillus soli]
MKILHAIGGGEFGGAEQHILELLEILSRHAVEPVVVCFYNSTFADELRKRNIRVIVLDTYSRFDFRLVKGLAHILETEKPDLVHSHGVKANFFCRLAIRQVPNTPIITTIHSVLRYDYPNLLAYFLASRMELWTRKWNNHYIAISNSIRQSLEADGVKPCDITLIHHGIPIESFAADQDVRSIQAELGIPAGAFVIGTVSRLVPVKGLTDLMQAFIPLADEQADIHWLIIGDGPEKEALAHTAREAGISDRVHFVGFRKDVARCLHAIDVFVSPSYSEGLGLSLLEAMAAKRPVVATMVGGIADFLVDYHNGLVISPHNPDEIRQNILILKEDDGLRQKIAEAGYETVKKEYTLTHMALRTKELYYKLARSK